MSTAILSLLLLLPSQTRPLALHPENPHYLLFRGQPAFLITSGEHYGALLNFDIDFEPYLDTLAADGFNLTRTFSGTYREVPGSFKIKNNTLAPKPGRYLAPWPNVANQNAPEKFDLDRWNDDYFQRLKRFLNAAGRRGIVVEFVLFCPLYEENLWQVSPMNAKNNVNGVGDCPRNEALTLKHPELVERQVAFVQKVVSELNGFDNLYYEVCNEPYFGGVTRDWQDRIIAAIVDTERPLPNQHLIAQNIANGKAMIEHPNPAVSIFNFHYARPPETVALNWSLKKPIADDETGFRGTKDLAYRSEGWDFLIAGGAIYDNLDYSFTSDHEDGQAQVTDPTPGGGGPGLRRQLATLRRFLQSFQFLRMAPDTTVIQAGIPEKATAPGLSEARPPYPKYIKGGTQAKLKLDLPAGRYRVHWLHPRSGDTVDRPVLDHKGGDVTVESPDYDQDIALGIVAIEGR